MVNNISQNRVALGEIANDYKEELAGVTANMKKNEEELNPDGVDTNINFDQSRDK